MCKYYPYKSQKPDKKYCIITENDEKVYFGVAAMSDFTIHKNKKSKNDTLIDIGKMNLNFGINQE